MSERGRECKHVQKLQTKHTGRWSFALSVVLYCKWVSASAFLLSSSKSLSFWILSDITLPFVSFVRPQNVWRRTCTSPFSLSTDPRHLSKGEDPCLSDKMLHPGTFTKEICKHYCYIPPAQQEHSQKRWLRSFGVSLNPKSLPLCQ